MDYPAHYTKVFAQIDALRRDRGSWTGRCPAHRDRTPSLRLSIGEEGRLLLWCGAGCTYKAILEALKLTERDLFVPEERQQLKYVEHYDYKNKDGVVVYQVVRYEPKTFRQRRTDSNGNVIWNL